MSNLPDDVTHDDIDRHFAPSERETVSGEVTLFVKAEVLEGSTKEEREASLREQARRRGEIVDVTIHDVS